jgi:bifunctional oligoribonuclease and PAP phosphatase NrnA
MISLITHVNPDGDALGAVFAAREMLREEGEACQVYLFGDLPRWFQDVWELLGSPPYLHDVSVPPGDCWLLDVPSVDRCGKDVPDRKQLEIRVMVDHHPMDKHTYYYAVKAFIDPAASSTCELLAGIEEYSINSHAASWLALGIRTDTLNFSTSNVSSTTHKVMYELLWAGAVTTPISTLIHRSMTKDLLLFQAAAVSNAHWFDDAVLMTAPLEVRLHFGVGENDSKVCLYPAGQLVDTDLVVLVIEADDGATLVSARSRTAGRAQYFCKQLGGGGHPNASGARVERAIYDVVNEILIMLDNGA